MEKFDSRDWLAQITNGGIVLLPWGLLIGPPRLLDFGLRLHWNRMPVDSIGRKRTSPAKQSFLNDGVLHFHCRLQ
jgi:hypothetical protein